MDIYNSSGEVILSLTPDDNSYRQRTIMGDHKVILYYSLPEHVEIDTGSYIIYSEETYYLMRPEAFTMHHTRDFEYTVTFEAYETKAKIWKFRNTVDGRLQFSYTATPKEHLQMFVDNMNRRDEGWEVGECIDGTETCISYDHAYCYDALGQMADTFETEFYFTGKVVNLAKPEFNKDAPLALSYGKGKGFKPDVGRENYGDTPPVEILYAQGGTTNIDISTNLDADGNGCQYLLLPKSQTISYDGEHFEDEDGYDDTNARTYAVDDNGLSITNVNRTLTSLAEDSVDLSDIYPKRVGTISAVECEDEDNHYWNFWDEDIPDDLDYDDCQTEDVMTVVFQSGMLAGKEFEVSEYVHESSGVAERRFELVPQEIDGITMPDKDSGYYPKAGDTYAVFNVNMPEAYVRDDDTKSGASWDMFREAVRYFYEHEDTQFTFSGELDGIWAAKDWTNIGGKILLGGYVFFTDERFAADGMLLRIIGIKDYVNRPYSPEIELSNSVVTASFSSALSNIAATEVLAKDYKTDAVQFTKRRFRDAQETLTLLQEAADTLSAQYTNAISPITVETMSLLVGDESLQFRFVDGISYPTTVSHSVTYDDDTKKLTVARGIIQHMTLGISSLSSTHSDDEYYYWYVPKFTSAALTDTSQAYYLYARCFIGETGEVNPGEFLLSTAAISLTLEEGYYMLLVGILNSEYDGTRSYVSLYGYTEVLPGRITTDRIVSGDATSYFDMAANAMKLGDVLDFNSAGDGLLRLKGTIIQSQGGEDEEYIGCYRGTYSDDITYYTGDTVTYTVNGTTSYYKMINSSSCTGVSPTNTAWWQVMASGATETSVITLTNSHLSVPCDSSGNILSSVDVTEMYTLVKVYKGSADITDDCTITTDYDTDEVGITLDGSTITLDSLSVDQATVDISTEVDDTTLTTTLTISKSYAGTDATIYRLGIDSVVIPINANYTSKLSTINVWVDRVVGATLTKFTAIRDILSLGYGVLGVTSNGDYIRYIGELDISDLFSTMAAQGVKITYIDFYLLPVSAWNSGNTSQAIDYQRVTTISDGADGGGQDTLVLELTNDNSVVVCDEDGNVTGAYETTTAILFEGTTDVTDQAASITISENNGFDTATYDDDTHVLTVDGLTQDTGTVTLCAIYDSLTRYATYTVKKLKAGADAVVYSLILSENVIKCDATGAPTADSITVSVKKTTGESSSLLSTTEQSTAGLIIMAARYDADGNVLSESNFSGSYDPAAFNCNDAAYISFYLLPGTYTDYTTEYYDLETLRAVQDGSDGAQGVSGASTIRLDLSNEYSAVACDYEGNPLSTAVYEETWISLYEGATDITNVLLGAIDVEADGISASLSRSVVTSTDDDGNTVTSYKFSIAPSNITQDTATITITATYNETEYKAVYTVVKVYAGAPGDTPTIYSLAPTTSVIKKDVDGDILPDDEPYIYVKETTGGTTTLLTTLDEVTDAGLVIYYVIDGSSVIKLSNDNLVWGDASIKERVVFYLADTSTGVYIDTETLPVVTDGEAGEGNITLVLTNETASVPCASDGTITNVDSTDTYESTRAYVYDGTTDVTDDATFTFAEDGIIKTFDEDTHTIYVSDMEDGVDSATITVKAKYNGYERTKYFTINRVYAGADAEDYSIVPSQSVIHKSNAGTVASALVLYVKHRKGASVEMVDTSEYANLGISFSFRTDNSSVPLVLYPGTYTIPTTILKNTSSSITIYLEVDGTIYDQQTLCVITDGADGSGENAVRVNLTNDNSCVLCDEDGTVLDTASYETSEVTVYDGSTDVTDECAITLVPYSITATYDEDTHVITISDITADNATVVVTAEYNGILYNSTYSIKKLRAGADAVLYSLITSLAAVPCTSAGVPMSNVIVSVKKTTGASSSIITSLTDLQSAGLAVYYIITDNGDSDTGEVATISGYLTQASLALTLPTLVATAVAAGTFGTLLSVTLYLIDLDTTIEDGYHDCETLPAVYNGATGATGATPDYTELRFQWSGSATTAPDVDSDAREPDGWTTAQGSGGSLQYLWMISATISNGELSGEWSDPVLMSGVKGDTGSSPAAVYRGTWSSSESYYGNEYRVDVVYYNSAYYVARVDAGTFNGTDYIPTNTDKWNSFGASFSSVATDLLLAELANIGGWIFRNSRLESQVMADGTTNTGSTTDTPAIFLDGTTGEASFANGNAYFYSTGAIKLGENFEVDADGNMTASGGTFAGTINANGGLQLPVVIKTGVTVSGLSSATTMVIMTNTTSTSDATLTLPSSPNSGQMLTIVYYGNHDSNTFLKIVVGNTSNHYITPSASTSGTDLNTTWASGHYRYVYCCSYIQLIFYNNTWYTTGYYNYYSR